MFFPVQVPKFSHFSKLNDIEHKPDGEKQRFGRAVMVGKVLVAAIFLACAVAEASGNDAAQLTARVKRQLKISPAIVTKMPFGLWEVATSDNRVFYVDDGVRYVFSGTVTDLSLGKNITQERIDSLSRVEWRNLPLSDAVTTKRGTGTLKVAVFADASCVFCRQLETYFNRMKDVTVYTFVYPMRRSRELARTVVCSPNPSQAWTRLMVLGETGSVSPACNDSVLDRNAALAEKIRVTGTPTIVFPNGQRLDGVPSYDSLVKLLKDNSAPE